MASTSNFETLARAYYGKKNVISPKNAHLATMPSDFLYHLGFSSQDELKALFSDVKLMICGGSASRMKGISALVAEAINYKMPTGTALKDLSTTDRFSMYKVGPVLFVSHGMGMPSMSIMLHEVTKLLHYAGATGVSYIRMGTSGGLGLEPGTLVVTKQPVNVEFKPIYRAWVLGKEELREAAMNTDLGDVIAAAWDEPTVPVARGNTMSTDDFYEGQGRLDGAICGYTEAQKMDFIQRAHDSGVRNIEMEAAMFGAFCHRLEIPSAIVCVTLVNRLLGDQITSDHATMAEYHDRISRIIVKFVKKSLDLNMF